MGAPHEYSAKHHAACERIEEEANSLTGQVEKFKREPLPEEFIRWALTGHEKWGLDTAELSILYHVTRRTAEHRKDRIYAETHKSLEERQGLLAERLPLPTPQRVEERD